MTVKSEDFESSASTNSTTPAFKSFNNNISKLNYQGYSKNMNLLTFSAMCGIITKLSSVLRRYPL